jgi:hypothetical protein
MSSNRQLGERAGGRDRNAVAEGNVSTRMPAWWIDASTAWRTAASLSTANTTGAVWDIGEAVAALCRRAIMAIFTPRQS